MIPEIFEDKKLLEMHDTSASHFYAQMQGLDSTLSDGIIFAYRTATYATI